MSRSTLDTVLAEAGTVVAVLVDAEQAVIDEVVDDVARRNLSLDRHRWAPVERVELTAAERRAWGVDDDTMLIVLNAKRTVAARADLDALRAGHGILVNVHKLIGRGAAGEVAP